MAPELIGLALACGASFLFYSGLALQAVEAREVSVEHAMRLSLLGQLLRRPRWLVGTALVLAGFPAQVLALGFAPLTLVQPALAAGLVLLLAIGSRYLGERVGAREMLGVGLMVVGVTALVGLSPGQSDSRPEALPAALVLVVVGLGAMSPLLGARRTGARGLIVAVGAGLAYAWAGLTTKLISIEWRAGNLALVLLWAGATAAAAGLAVLAESSALQRRPATQVGPVVIVVDILVAVVVSPLLTGEDWRDTPLAGAALLAAALVVVAGTAMLASSRAVAGAVGDQHLG